MVDELLTYLAEKIRPRKNVTYLRYGDRPYSSDTPNFMVEGNRFLPYYNPKRGANDLQGPGAMKRLLKDLWYDGVEEDYNNGRIGSFDDIRRIRVERRLDAPAKPQEAESQFENYDDEQVGGEATFFKGKPESIARDPRYTKEQEAKAERMGKLGEKGLEESSELMSQYARGESPLDKLAMRAISEMSKPYQPRYSVPSQQESPLGGILEALSDPDLAELVGTASKKFGPLLEGDGIGRITRGVKGLFSR